MNRILILGIFLLSLAYEASAQKFVLGNVSVEELLEKKHPADTSASASVLYEKGRTYFKYIGYWQIITEVERRIKIYDKAGYDYATQELTFYKGDADLNQFTDTYTYNLVDGNVVKTKLEKESEFITPKGTYAESRKIFFPDVREGSIIEFKYVKTRLWRGYIPDWYFQENIPVNSSDYSVAIPAYFTYNSILSGDVKINMSPQEVVKGEKFQENRVTYYAKNVPAIRNEPYADNVNNYLAVVKHELAGYTGFGGEETKLATSWKTMVINLYESKNFGKQLEANGYFKKDIDALLHQEMQMKDKMNAIFSFVQQRMEWNDYGGIETDNGVKEAYQLKKGNVADINLMLIAMFKYAGIDAVPVILATRDRSIPVYPSIEAFNYVVCGVQSGGDFILFDASGKHNNPGMISSLALNRTGRKIRPDGSAIEVDLTPKIISKEVSGIFAAIDNEGNVSGKIRKQYSDYLAVGKKTNSGESKKEEYLKGIENDLKGSEISDYIIIDEPGKPVREEYSFKNNKLSDHTGGKILINPMLFFGDEQNPFKSEKRVYPINFMFPYQDKKVINLTIPEGYEIESAPSAASIVMGGGMFSFKYDLVIKDNQIQLSVFCEVKESFIVKENYQAVRDFFSKMAEKQSEKIILKKA